MSIPPALKSDAAKGSSVLRRPQVAPPLRRPNNARDSRPPHPNAIDHSISQRNGYTYALEFSAPRLRSSKEHMSQDPRVRNEQMTREMGYLRCELKLYRECFVVLQQLREGAYDVYQQLFLASYFPPTAERLHQLTVQLHRCLEQSMRREVAAEREWKSFWGVDVDHDNPAGGFV